MHGRSRGLCSFHRRPAMTDMLGCLDQTTRSIQRTHVQSYILKITRSSQEHVSIFCSSHLCVDGGIILRMIKCPKSHLTNWLFPQGHPESYFHRWNWIRRSDSILPSTSHDQTPCMHRVEKVSIVQGRRFVEHQNQFLGKKGDREEMSFATKIAALLDITMLICAMQI